MAPRLSVITPSFNYGRFIDDCLSSVQHQVPPAHEHLVLDDGSSDDSLQLARAHPASTVAWGQPNVGLATTLNRLVDRVSGDWVGWLNADDFYLAGAFESFQRVVAAHPGSDAVIGDTLWVDEQAHVLRLLPCHRITPSFTQHYGMSAAPSAMFFRTELLRALRFNEDTRFLMDKWLLAQAATAGYDLRYVPITFGAMRRHGAQVSANAVGPAATAERRAFREAFGLPMSGRMLKLSQQYGKLQHRALKVTSGGYLRQLRTRREAGSDARWWLTADADHAGS
jgi:glycosyltransferase involved in cell wall biosynthesis